MRLLLRRQLLLSHRAWLKLQRCKDRFEPLLGLDALKSSALPDLAAAPSSEPGSSSNGGAAASAAAGPGLDIDAGVA